METMVWKGHEELDAGPKDLKEMGERLERSLTSYGWLRSEPALVGPAGEDGKHEVLDARQRVHVVADMEARGMGTIPIPCVVLEGKAAKAALVVRRGRRRAGPWEERVRAMRDCVEGNEDRDQGIRETAAVMGMLPRSIRDGLKALDLIEEGTEGEKLEARLHEGSRLELAIVQHPGTWDWWLGVGRRAEGGSGPKDAEERRRRLDVLLGVVFDTSPRLGPRDLELLGGFVEEGGDIAEVRKLGGLAQARKARQSGYQQGRDAVFEIERQSEILREALAQGKGDSDDWASCAKLMGEAYRMMGYAWRALGRKLADGGPSKAEGEAREGG